MEVFELKGKQRLGRGRSPPDGTSRLSWPSIAHPIIITSTKRHVEWCGTRAMAMTRGWAPLSTAGK
jgi:hypothetical protein